MNKNRISPLFGAMLASLAFGASGAFAQATAPVKPTYEIPGGESKAREDGPRGILLQDGVSLFPSLGLSYGRDSNLFLTRLAPTSSNKTSIAPGLKLQALSSSSVFTFDYTSDSAKYESSSADNYSDYHLGGVGEMSFGSRVGLRLGVEDNKGHDPRGSTDRGLSARPDVFSNSGFNGLFAYGGNDANGRVELEAGSYNKRYKNNRATTFGSDRDTTNFGGRFFARVASKTHLLVEATQDKFDYKSTSSLFDSKERRFLVGVTWEATAATSGTVKVGQIRKDFTSSIIKDFSGTGWDAVVQWAPQSYSRLDLFTTKSFIESTGLGDFILSKNYGVSWSHDWNSRFYTVASASRKKDDFVGGARNDTTDSVGVKVNYKVQRWLTFGGEFTNADRDSNNAAFKYKRNIYSLTLGATL
jgi:hypothetical protein